MSFIIIQGSVGAGKTTLCEHLSKEFGYKLYPEPVNDNPYLDEFYNDPDRYAYKMQLFLLTTRYLQAVNASKNKDVIMDMSVYGTDIFTGFMWQNLNINNEDYSVYQTISQIFKSHIKEPDLMVYLRCRTDVCVERIIKRGRPSELKASNYYWTSLNQSYEDWYKDYKGSKKMCIDVSDIDLVQNKEDMSAVVNRIRTTIKGLNYK